MKVTIHLLALLENPSVTVPALSLFTAVKPNHEPKSASTSCDSSRNDPRLSWSWCSSRAPSPSSSSHLHHAVHLVSIIFHQFSSISAGLSRSVMCEPLPITLPSQSRSQAVNFTEPSSKSCPSKPSRFFFQLWAEFLKVEVEPSHYFLPAICFLVFFWWVFDWVVCIPHQILILVLNNLNYEFKLDYFAWRFSKILVGGFELLKFPHKGWIQTQLWVSWIKMIFGSLINI